MISNSKYIIIFLLIALPSAGLSIQITDPKPYSVINSDLVRVKASVSQQVEWIELLASFEDLQGNRKHISLGRMTAPPFEAVWDCSQAPDQNFGRLFFYFNYKDKLGIYEKCGLWDRRDVVIDRQVAYAPTLYNVPKTDRSPETNGILDEWDTTVFQTFSGSDNRIRFGVVWDMEFLYFAVQVYDEYLQCQQDKTMKKRYAEDDTEYPQLSLGDGIEFNFDIMNSKLCIRDTSHRELMISADGTAYDLVQANHKRRVLRWAGQSRVKVRLRGTLNQPADRDTGFCVEAAISWTDLLAGLGIGNHPSAGMEIGFDLFNYDREQADGNWTFASWSVHTNKPNNDNPSEWGTLVIAGKKGYPLKWIGLSIVFALLILVLTRYFFRSGQTRPSDSEEEALSKLVVKKGAHSGKMEEAVSFLESNLDRKTDLEQVAKHVNLGYGRLRQLFVEYTGKSYTDFLVDLKIDKAKLLLAQEVQLSVSEIAFRLGYDQLPQFSQIFKKRTGLSPQEYRDRNRKE